MCCARSQTDTDWKLYYLREKDLTHISRCLSIETEEKFECEHAKTSLAEWARNEFIYSFIHTESVDLWNINGGGGGSLLSRHHHRIKLAPRSSSLYNCFSHLSIRFPSFAGHSVLHAAVSVEDVGGRQNSRADNGPGHRALFAGGEAGEEKTFTRVLVG